MTSSKRTPEIVSIFSDIFPKVNVDHVSIRQILNAIPLIFLKFISLQKRCLLKTHL